MGLFWVGDRGGRVSLRLPKENVLLAGLRNPEAKIFPAAVLARSPLGVRFHVWFWTSTDEGVVEHEAMLELDVAVLDEEPEPLVMLVPM